MSKLLATKVSTPLSENVQIGPKVSIFWLATIIFQHCLNPLGHDIHQSFTGCHWCPLPLLHDDITELVDVRALLSSTFRLRMPHRCSIGFRSGDMLGQSITFTLSFFSKAVVVIMLEYSPASQSREGRGSCSASVCHSTCWHSWFPQWTVAAQCRQQSRSPRPWHSHHHAWL